MTPTMKVVKTLPRLRLAISPVSRAGVHIKIQVNMATGVGVARGHVQIGREQTTAMRRDQSQRKRDNSHGALAGSVLRDIPSKSACVMPIHSTSF